MPAHKKFPALGRGLDALISTDDELHTGGSSSINEVPVEKIKANPNQPRREFSETSLEELAESIRQIGIIQPITLRQMEDGTYQIIAGERRWRASQMAGLNSVPAYVRTADDEKMMQMALVENIQREDLNASEIALALGGVDGDARIVADVLVRAGDIVEKRRLAAVGIARQCKLLHFATSISTHAASVLRRVSS